MNNFNDPVSDDEVIAACKNGYFFVTRESMKDVRRVLEGFLKGRADRRREWLSESFNRGSQTLDEATVSARDMARSMGFEDDHAGEREAYEAMWDAREASRGPNENFEGPCSCCQPHSKS